jgi:hypothetical protein
MVRKWILLLSVVASLLTACTRPPATRVSGTGIAPVQADSATLTLAARPSEVASGSTTILMIRVEAGNVSMIDIAVKNSRPFGTNIALGETGGYSFTSPVITEETTFVVTAKNAKGERVGTAETTVTVTNPEDLPAAPEVAAPPTTAPEETGLPEGTVRVASLAELQGATTEESTATTILVAGTIICDADPCVRLKAGQTLKAESSNAPAILSADRTNEGDLTTVIELAPDTTLEGIEISGPDIYTAINGIDATLSGTVIIKDVTITGPTANAPLAVRQTVDSGTYALKLDGLTVTGATKPIGLANFEQLEFVNSNLDMNIPDGSRGLIFQTGGTGTVLLNNLTITSAVASDTFTPVSFTNVGADGTLGVTVSNTTITFPNASPEALATARSLAFETNTATGKIAIQTSMSTANSTQATSPEAVVYDVAEGADPATAIFGYVQGTSGDGSSFPER